MNLIQFETHCKICRQPLTVEIPDRNEPFRNIFERLALQVATHDNCLDDLWKREKAHQILNEIETKADNFRKVCPKEFLKEINPNAAGYNTNRRYEVAGWVYSPKGLILVGPSGRCKTRFAWKLLEAENNRGRKVNGITHAEFRAKVSALAASDTTLVFKFISGLEACDVLLLDDLGKGRRTPAAEEALFLMIDKRIEKNLPTIFTMNTSLEVFAAQCSEEYREPLVRRIRENNQIIQF